MTDFDPFELEPSRGDFVPVVDNRPTVPQPLPVRLVAVEDVRLPALAGVEDELDEFYVKMLEFERDRSGEQLVYRADNFRLCFAVMPPPIQHDGHRPVQIEVLSLREAERKVFDAQIEYLRQRGLTPGSESLLLRDPCGNYVELVERREII
jgi:hypothetical protein